jgi:CRISPR-associated protein Csx17
MPDVPTHDLALPGCTPEPLMAYLKALGVLRLVSAQADSDARGWWKNDVFRLRCNLDRDALAGFFLTDYQPTPIVAPWAGGSGFFRKDNKMAVGALEGSTGARVSSYAEVIRTVQAIIKNENVGDKPKDQDKARLIRRYRRELPDGVVAWMDAAMVLQQEGQSFAPMLGTGGNDGRLDFTQNFMQRIVALGLHKESEPSGDSCAWLAQSLFATPAKLDAASVGQFAPGRAGGPNATQGMEGDSTDNPWDFILMIEGSLLLAGAAVRRFGVSERGKAAFPFTVRATAAGFDSSAASDEADSRGELWLPLWSRPTSADEARQLFGEGRADIGGRRARDGADFARSVAGLGINRGIDGFTRISFLKRSGKAYLAAPIGRVGVVERPSVDLLREIDPWLDPFSRAARDKNAPARFTVVLHAIDRAVFDFCRYGGQSLFQRILVALGRAERELALTEGKVGNSKIKPKPLAGLSRNWVNAANDNSREFEVALALAGIHDQPASKADVAKIGPFRTNLELVDWDKRYRAWATKDRSVVWNAADLSTNLAAVLERRVMDGERANCKNLPLASRDTASFGAISAFLSCEVDDERIEGLLWGLMLIDHPGSEMRNSRRAARGPSVEGSADSIDLLPSIYCLLRLLFLPRPLVAERSGENAVRWRLAGPDEPGFLRMRPEPIILSLLRTGRVGDAATVAMRRLRASGLTPLPHRRSSGVSRDHEWTELSVPLRTGRRLAASLLIPIHPDAVNALVQKVTRADDYDDRFDRSADREPKAIAADQGD